MDIRTPEAWTSCTIPGSANQCIYEIAFLDEIAKRWPDRSAPLVAFGESDAFYGAALAVERLLAAGYHRARILAGGLQAWAAAGQTLRGSGEPPAGLAEGTYTLDRAASRIGWTGRNLLNQHYGTLGPSGGRAVVGSGGLTAAEVTAAMDQITVEDIKDPDLAAVLVNHLRHDDFFAAAEHPQARFILEAARQWEGAPYAGSPNCTATGRLEIRGIPASIEIGAILTPISDGFVFHTRFDFDRTRHGSRYGSARFFERLGQHLVNDRIDLDIRAVFRRE